MIKNVLYSTSRQWNPGDEFILMGTIKIMNKVIGPHNMVIYNRNPDVRLPRVLKTKDFFHLGFNDNSLKTDTDCSFIDLAVFAGTPEWCNELCNNLYKHISDNSIPTLFIGLGSNNLKLNPLIKDVLSKSLYISFRDKKLNITENIPLPPIIYKACPAMLCVPIGQEKKIDNVRTVGLGFAVSRKYSVVNNCVGDDVYDYVKDLCLDFIDRYKGTYKICIICHYIDELPIAHKIFADYDVEILYSYNSSDYQSIYSNIDVLISSRVHGCGIASSLGIPSISIMHDNRATTTELFMSERVDINTSYADVFDLFESVVENIPAINQKLIKYKREVFESYVDEIKQRLSFERISYSNFDTLGKEVKNIWWGRDDEIPKHIDLKSLYYFIGKNRLPGTNDLHDLNSLKRDLDFFLSMRRRQKYIRMLIKMLVTQRMYRKLKRNPKAFFADSKSKFIRVLGKYYI